jgi:hypothetical protein
MPSAAHYDMVTTMPVPVIEAKLTLPLFACLTWRPNRWLGADGLCVGALDLKIDFGTLQDTCRAYAREHGGNVSIKAASSSSARGGNRVSTPTC